MMNEGYVETKISDNILLLEVPDRNRRCYNIKLRLSDEPILNIRSTDLKGVRLTRPLNDKTIFLISAILKINGVQSIVLDGYEIKIEKGKVFDWEKDNIHDEIIKTLEKFQE